MVRRSMLVLSAFLLTAAAIWFMLDPNGTTSSIRRIAVLPLEDLSPGSTEAYFTDGITEELISKLAHISGLDVIAHTSSMRYRQAALDVGIVRRELNAGTVLGGSVRPAGNRARIVVHLIDATRGQVVWTDEYDRELRDILAVQNDVALRVSEALKVQLLDAERVRLEHRGTESPAAHRLVLLARHHLHRRTTEDVQKAGAYFAQATEVDPRYVDAWVGLAECHILFAGAGYGNVPRERAVAEARAAVKKALELHPHSPDALAVLACLQYRLDWNWAAADTSFATAVSWKPGDARLHEWRGLFLALRGDTRAGVVEMERALALDPRSPSMGTGLGRLLSFDGQDERAIRHLQQVVREHPQYAEAHCALGLAYGYAGRTAESIASLERAVSLSDRRPVILANLGYTLARAGRRPEALAILSELDSLSRIRPISPWVRSMVHFGLGEIDRGLDLMQESLDQGEGLLAYVKVEPMPPEVRSHPRFQEMIRQIGLQP
jgi:TolB-like protein/Flp pilus assembly protein TadD